eukprot:GHUV01025133.1.p1 GENE.GHUV01025133.1~~GHUV01025133.1.p1  ORF type:complete len:315 (+),score=112.25 GHUV01025133.1:391-1335(+)
MADATRQKMAADLNLSETAFIEPLQPDASQGSEVFQQQDTFKLRWFTPAIEVPLCGHATLASAAIVFSECQNPAATLHFQTLSGTLTVTKQQQSNKQLLQMSLPASPALDQLPSALLPHGSISISRDGSKQPDLQQLLQNHTGLQELLTACLQGPPAAPAADASPAEATQYLLSTVEHVGYCAAVKYLLVVLKGGTGRRGLEQLRPDFRRMAAAVGGDRMIGVIVTAAAEPGDEYDLYSRFFGPWAGIHEDPVTGSAHAVLAPYWSQLLDKQQLFGRQCSERGGDVWMDAAAQAGKVLVSGEATLVEQRVSEYD